MQFLHMTIMGGLFVGLMEIASIEQAFGISYATANIAFTAAIVLAAASGLAFSIRKRRKASAVVYSIGLLSSLVLAFASHCQF